jgi:hypothetical protein
MAKNYSFWNVFIHIFKKVFSLIIINYVITKLLCVKIVLFHSNNNKKKYLTEEKYFQFTRNDFFISVTIQFYRDFLYSYLKLHFVTEPTVHENLYRNRAHIEQKKIAFAAELRDLHKNPTQNDPTQKY